MSIAGKSENSGALTTPMSDTILKVIINSMGRDEDSIIANVLMTKLSQNYSENEIKLELLRMADVKFIKINGVDPETKQIEATTNTLKLRMPGIDRLCKLDVIDYQTAGFLSEKIGTEDAYKKALYYYMEAGRCATGSGEGLASEGAISRLRARCKDLGIKI